MAVEKPDPQINPNSRSYMCMFHANGKSPELLLSRINHLLPFSESCTNVENWRDTGAECDIRINDRIVVNVILGRLFGIPDRNYLINISLNRSWKEFFSAMLGKKSSSSSTWNLSELLEPIDIAIRRCGIAPVLWWTSDKFPDFSVPALWSELPYDKSVCVNPTKPPRSLDQPTSRACQLLRELHQRNYGNTQADFEEIETILWEYGSLDSDDNLPPWFLKALELVHADQSARFEFKFDRNESESNAASITQEFQDRLHWDVDDDGEWLLIRFPSQNLELCIDREGSVCEIKRMSDQKKIL